MKMIKNLYCLGFLVLFFSCNKYANINPDKTINGYVYLQDPFKTNFPVPLAGKTIYFNRGSDTSSYLLQTTTDSGGHFSMTYIGDDNAILFSSFVKDGVVYKGDTIVTAAQLGKAVQLNVLPVYHNGVQLNFKDNSGGLVSGLKFRIYTSTIAASVDSVKYSYLNSKADNSGHYTLFNLNAGDYFVVAKDNIGGVALSANQKITVAKTGLSSPDIIIK
ncbi:hypothetical protein [Mucilaginibacter psychrotolerans]|uniref:Carboxypeptidase regulatory-like domain-containing protein n=1 Tax=Mucilaginibacter psychrotolerans TaxID=1524096 RepID=A0A4Y8S805_9SPHI|nr:hypothetical protein [Mucilaginibacter psychrotolerans]TFF34554.1 hypothetical protein E2R66_21640 [Mucilaginibacter psychrotolerans]